MTANVIDINLHGSAFPATYTGPGNLIGNPIVSVDGMVAVSGYFTGAGNAVNIPLGFQPTYICVVDPTDNITYEWYRGLAATNTIKTVAAGTRTVDTGSAIVVSTDYAGNSTVTLAAAVAVSASLIAYRIEG